MEGIDWIDFVTSVGGRGFDHIELRVGDVGDGAPIFDRDYLRRVKRLADGSECTLSLHSLVGTNLGEKVGRIREASVGIICDVMEAARYVGASWVTTHLGSGGFSNSDVSKKFGRLDCVIDGVREVLRRTGDSPVDLALENLPRYLPERGQCRLGDRAEEFEYILDNLDSKRVHVLFDVAHARVNAERAEDVKLFIDTVKSRIVGFHLHWNDGSNDSHLPLTRESIDEIETYFSGSSALLADGVPLLFECYSLEENIVCKQLIQSNRERVIHA